MSSNPHFPFTWRSLVFLVVIVALFWALLVSYEHLQKQIEEGDDASLSTDFDPH